MLVFFKVNLGTDDVDVIGETGELVEDERSEVIDREKVGTITLEAAVSFWGPPEVGSVLEEVILVVVIGAFS